MLSDFAEDQLCAEVGRGVFPPFSTLEALVSRRCSKAAVSPETVYLVRLRRLHRRLRHLVCHPYKDQLRVRVHRDIHHFRDVLQGDTPPLR